MYELFEADVRQLVRKCGPEPEMKFWQDRETFERDIKAIAQSLESIEDLPPLVVEEVDGQLVVCDGTHRLEAIRAKRWASCWVIQFSTAENREDCAACTCVVCLRSLNSDPLGGANIERPVHDEPLGLRRGEVVLRPYDSRWPTLFESARSELESDLGSAILGVRHVGSTSVPGLCAKPILDLLVLVRDFVDSRRLAPRLLELGYEFRPEEEIPDRHYFRRPPGGKFRTHHLSIAEPDSRHTKVQLAFRDALRDDPVRAASYAHLKESLAERFPFDRPAYIEGKSDFVRDVLASIGLT